MRESGCCSSVNTQIDLGGIEENTNLSLHSCTCILPMTCSPLTAFHVIPHMLLQHIQKKNTT